MPSISGEVHVLGRIFLHVEQAAVLAVLHPSDLVLHLLRIAELDANVEDLQLRERWALVELGALDGRAVRVELALPSGVGLLAKHELVRVLQQRLVADVQLLPRVAAVEDGAPLRDAVHGAQHRQAARLEPLVRLRGRGVGGVHTGELAERAVPVRDGHDAAVPRPTLLGGDEAAGDEGVRAHAALPVAVLAALQRVVVRGARLVDGAAVVGREDDEGVVPHALGLHRIDGGTNGLVHPQSHGGVEPAVL
mmetsp:Transcript_70190/g.196722  ORF Transcript_70190/g.196722 Transcript_70190/m.196722 type:complete len:250 (-) Transcript_70190:926-1675(-)